MKKYDKRVIEAYINGNDLDDYSIEELENDKKFMMDVIKLTQDKRFYHLCSNLVKKDYEFVLFMIVCFKSDIPFICKVADFYLEDAKDVVNPIELVIIMTAFTRENKMKYNHYMKMRNMIFIDKRIQIENIKVQLTDEKKIKKIGMGFLLLFDIYHSSKVVIDFYAKGMIQSIFIEHDIDLEKMVLEQFNRPEQINQIGIYNYLLRFIGLYDTALASYLSTHIELLTEWEIKIKEIQKNWYAYKTREEYNQYHNLFEKVHNYMEEKGKECTFNETTLLYYLGKKLGVLEKIAKYDGLGREVTKKIIDGLDERFIEDILEANHMDRVYANDIKKIMQSIIFPNSSKKLKDNKKKILEFPLK